VEPSPRGRRPGLAASDGGGFGLVRRRPRMLARSLLLALQPFPPCIASGKETDEGSTCGQSQEIASVDHPVVRHRTIFVPTLMRPQVTIVLHSCLIYPTFRTTGKSL
jgi:hypothetical protein